MKEIKEIEKEIKELEEKEIKVDQVLKSIQNRIIFLRGKHEAFSETKKK